jgi:hypothetical protein
MQTFAERMQELPGNNWSQQRDRAYTERESFSFSTAATSLKKKLLSLLEIQISDVTTKMENCELFPSLLAYVVNIWRNSVAVARKRTIPTERPPLVGEVSANFCG